MAVRDALKSAKARDGVANGQTPFGSCIVRGNDAVAIEVGAVP